MASERWSIFILKSFIHNAFTKNPAVMEASRTFGHDIQYLEIRVTDQLNIDAVVSMLWYPLKK
jgi:hypothetical protein